jgi:hypothetical protein
MSRAVAAPTTLFEWSPLHFMLNVGMKNVLRMDPNLQSPHESVMMDKEDMSRWYI